MAAPLEARFLEHARSLRRQGILDTSQFSQLQMLQDENDPNFVREIVGLYFDDSEKILNDVSSAMDQQVPDFGTVYERVHQLKGTSSYIGAQRIKNVCAEFCYSCEQKSGEGCHRCLGAANQEYFLLKKELQCLIQIEQAILKAGGKAPMID